MSKTLTTVYLSKRNTYVLTCPSCRQSQEIHASELPPMIPNPYVCTCPCETTFTVQLISLRAFPRKPVKLVGSFTLDSTTAKIQLLCTVEDISLTGMRATTGPLKNVAPGVPLQASIVLDNHTRTIIKLPCKVCRIVQDRGQMVLGVEFVDLSPRQKDILQAYTTHDIAVASA